MMMMMTFLHWLAAIRLSEGSRLPGWLVLLLPAGAELGQKTVEKIRPSFPQADFLALWLTWAKRLLRKSDHPSLRLTS